MRVLCGDIGGTKTELAIYEGPADSSDGLREVAAHRFASAGFESFDALLSDFAGRAASGPGGSWALDAAAFGVAGPVAGGRCVTTNLPWELLDSTLTAQLGAPVSLINDFHAMALGVGELAPSQLLTLAAGSPDPRGPTTVLGAGTGFGCAHLVRSRHGQPAVLPSEAGHADFSPPDAEAEALLAFARARLGGRVSVERVVSGPGVALVYDFLVETGRCSPTAETRSALASVTAPEDRPGVIGPRGVDGSDPACRAAVDLFLALYGAECGNVALRMLPTGGLYIAGGVAGRLSGRLPAGGFMEALWDKAPMRTLLQQLPVHLVLEPRTGLLGARAEARMLYSRLSA